MGAKHPTRNLAKYLASRPRNVPAMPPNVRQDDSQDNLPCVGLGRAMSAPESGETTRNLSAQQSCNGQGNISQTTRRNPVASFQP
jgi:hypothetical protein